MDASRPLPISPPYRLIYASRIAPVCQDDLRAALMDIVPGAIGKNRALRVSGLLVAHKGWFVQVLEGRQDAVERLFETITSDRRHHHALPLSAGHADARLFEAWSMAARVLASGDEAVLAALNPKDEFDPTRAPERTILRLLTTVADVHWRWLGEQQRLAAA
ncbi:MAG TPA: BLUF domain-containing protein [Caulobacteraceae bacterium]|nr:BLUF domain-containing protein [Caulobacteraceae bacterium]